MFQQITQWWNNRQRGRERVSFDRGYQWSKFAMQSGSYTPEALLVLADGAFNDGAMARAWDKGVTTAAGPSAAGMQAPTMPGFMGGFAPALAAPAMPAPPFGAPAPVGLPAFFGR